MKNSAEKHRQSQKSRSLAGLLPEKTAAADRGKLLKEGPLSPKPLCFLSSMRKLSLILELLQHLRQRVPEILQEIFYSLNPLQFLFHIRLQELIDHKVVKRKQLG